MNQLWAWEYEGQDEVGIKSIVDRQELFAVKTWISLVRRTTSQVTDLRKVKVVDEDAIIFDKEVLDHWKKLLSEKKWYELLDSVTMEIEPPSPVTEPKNFGAIVEASTRHYGFQSWFLAKNGTWTGENEDHVDWSDLINPTIISEGVEG